jgi:RNA polymerase sigma factor (sigma-70 family)
MTTDRQFPETRWSQLLTLRDATHPLHVQCLDRLIRQYWKPVYHFVRVLRPVRPDDAEDLAQQFFTLLLGRRDFEKLSPERGSFRGFLKAAVKNFLIDQDRAGAARSPRDGARMFPYEEAEAVWQDGRRGRRAPSPEEAFDQEWARAALEEALARLKRSLSAEGKEAYFAIFMEYWLESAGGTGAVDSAHRAGVSDPSYATLAREHSISEADVGNYLRYARQSLRAALREVVLEYAGSDDEIERELRFILSR